MHAIHCPHCDAPAPAIGRISRTLGVIFGSGALAVTLMACYGLPPCDADDDRDRDGAYAGYCDDYNGITLHDCDDTNPAIHECADDPEGDGIDQNCDGADGRNTSTSTTYDVCNQT
jgi:hypothetical protein